MYFTEPDSLISAIVNIVSFINSVSRRLKNKCIGKLLLVAGCWLLVGQLLIGQLTGDYRSVVDGNWSTFTNWQRLDGFWAGIQLFEGYPGQNSIPGRVDINTNITLDLSPANPVGDLNINSGTLELSSHDFTVNGITNISSTLSDNDINGLLSFMEQ